MKNRGDLSLSKKINSLSLSHLNREKSGLVLAKRKCVVIVHWGRISCVVLFVVICFAWGYESNRQRPQYNRQNRFLFAFVCFFVCFFPLTRSHIDSLLCSVWEQPFAWAWGGYDWWVILCDHVTFSYVHSHSAQTKVTKISKESWGFRLPRSLTSIKDKKKPIQTNSILFCSSR